MRGGGAQYREHPPGAGESFRATTAAPGKGFGVFGSPVSRLTLEQGSGCGFYQFILSFLPQDPPRSPQISVKPHLI